MLTQNVTTGPRLDEKAWADGHICVYARGSREHAREMCGTCHAKRGASSGMRLAHSSSSRVATRCAMRRWMHVGLLFGLLVLVATSKLFAQVNEGAAAAGAVGGPPRVFRSEALSLIHI